MNERTYTMVCCKMVVGGMMGSVARRGNEEGLGTLVCKPDTRVCIPVCTLVCIPVCTLVYTPACIPVCKRAFK